MKHLFTFAILFILAFSASAQNNLKAQESIPEMFNKKVNELNAELDTASGYHKGELLIRLGRFNEAENYFITEYSDSKLLMARLYLLKYDFEEFNKLMQGVKDSEEKYSLQADYLYLSGDMKRFTALSEVNRDIWVTAKLNLGRIYHNTFKFNEARELYKTISSGSYSHKYRSDAYRGLSTILLKERKYQESLDTLMKAFQTGIPGSAMALDFANVLIRLGRISEAIEMARISLKLNPYNEAAHYYLGNGYADLNYTQLEEKYPASFAKGEKKKQLDNLKKELSEGKNVTAELIKFQKNNPSNVEVLNILGSVKWTEGNYDSALVWYFRAINICPGYGRAYNGISKSLEKKAYGINVYREDDEREFKNTPMPDIPGIEEFVVNWKSLSDRHKKRVALSIAPFKNFIPVLIRGRATYYIKPLYEKLSECPNYASIKDTRIDYDSRLWDDVRGAGGHHTVTGIEDVEKTIFRSYNTVLHELSHQVHGTFPTGDYLEVMQAYLGAKADEAKGVKRFVSYYQGQSVWEYFAEGVNSYFSPRRNDLDTRDIVRERLYYYDTVLVKLVEKYVNETDVSRFMGQAVATHIYDLLGKDSLKTARAELNGLEQEILKTEPVLGVNSYLSSIEGKGQKAADLARELISLYPQHSAGHEQLASIDFMNTGKYAHSLRILKSGESKVILADQPSIQQSIATAYYNNGIYDSALIYYKKVLEAQADNENALWGLALSYARLNNPDEADKYFKQTLLRRSGIIGLRIDYAEFLLEQGRTKEAEAQAAEAEVLNASDSYLNSLKARLEKDPAKALEYCERALKKQKHNDDARFVRAAILLKMGKKEEAAKQALELKALFEKLPVWYRDPDLEYFSQVNTWNHFKQQRLEKLLNEVNI